MKKILLILCLFSLVACSSVVKEPEENNPPIEEEPSEEEPIEEEEVVVPETFINIYTGLKVDAQATKAIAVMIGNTTAARPQSGLSQADVVYEIRVEGGILRLMAIFSSQFPEKVGPIRSARIPFVQKVNEWGVGIAHFGAAGQGQGDAQTYLVKNKPVMRYDGVKAINSEFFFRTTDRRAPHNAYIRLNEAIVKAPLMALKPMFQFDTDFPVGGSDTRNFDITFDKGYVINYTYDPYTLKYTRSINKVVQVDANNNQTIQVKNVIVQYVTHQVVEKVGYVLVDFTSSGVAHFFIQGKHVIGTWKYNTESKITDYFDDAGHPMKIKPGNTWITVALNTTTITLN